MSAYKGGGNQRDCASERGISLQTNFLGTAATDRYSKRLSAKLTKNMVVLGRFVIKGTHALVKSIMARLIGCP